MKITYKRMIQTAPYEGVHLKVSMETGSDDPESLARTFDSVIDPWESHIRRHYLPSADRRMYRGREGIAPDEKRKPTAATGRRVHQDTVNFLLEVKKQSPLWYHRLNGIAKNEGLPDASFWTVDEAYEKFIMISGK